MKQLTNDEKAYLKIAYNKGYRYVVTCSDGISYFYSKEPLKDKYGWYCKTITLFCKSLCDFGISWEDDVATRIADLLGIDGIDWTQVKPFTPVFVRDYDTHKWRKAYFLSYDDSVRGGKYEVTWTGEWTYYIGNTTSHWYQCKLATQEEINEVEQQ